MSGDAMRWGPSRSSGMRIGGGRPQRGGQCCGCTTWSCVRGEASVFGGEGEGEPLSVERGTTTDAGGGKGGRRREDELFGLGVEALGSERCSNLEEEKDITSVLK